ncbi:MAG: hypothetical protein ABR562_00325 [Thermoplasmatota archaeon]|nr:hypothetical protein [Halobacteriales archaeon]
MDIRIETPLRPTEDEAKVRAAIVGLWPDAVVKMEGGRVVAVSKDVRPFRKRVWELRIIDAVRGKLLHGLAADGRSANIRLSKQAALAGMVSFPPTPHALGDLEVTLAVEPGDPWPDAEGMAWWLAPETKDGEVVGAVKP